MSQIWKPGTKLRCINSDGCFSIQKDKVYEFVQYVAEDRYYIILDDIASIWAANRFVISGCPCAVKGCIKHHA